MWMEKFYCCSLFSSQASGNHLHQIHLFKMSMYVLYKLGKVVFYLQFDIWLHLSSMETHCPSLQVNCPLSQADTMILTSFEDDVEVQKSFTFVKSNVWIPRSIEVSGDLLKIWSTNIMFENMYLAISYLTAILLLSFWSYQCHNSVLLLKTMLLVYFPRYIRFPSSVSVKV